MKRISTTQPDASTTGRTSTTNRDSLHDRRGIVTAMVVVVLILMSGLVVEFARRAIDERRQMRAEFDYTQTLELARAGVLSLQNSDNTGGDSRQQVLEFPAGELHQTKSAELVISVEDAEATVTARFPMDQDAPFQVTRNISF